MEIGENGNFLISAEGKSYIVNIGDDKSFPSCSCKDWNYYKMPCVHIIAAIRSEGVIEWEKLSSLYMESVYCTVDGVMLFLKYTTLYLYTSDMEKAIII